MSFGELLSGTPSFLTLSTFADSAIWEQWGKCCLKSRNCPVCFVSPQNGPWLCQKEALELSKWDLGSWEGHVCHGPFSSFKHGSVSGYKAWQTESWANIVVCNNAIGAKLDWHGFPLSWFFSYVAALPSPILQKRPQTTIQVPSLVGKTNLFTLFS